MYIYMAFFNEYYPFERITELDTLYAKFMLWAGLVHASQRHQIFMHLQSVYNSLPPPAEAKHYTACELSDVLELCNERILGFHPGLPHMYMYIYY